MAGRGWSASPDTAPVRPQRTASSRSPDDGGRELSFEMRRDLSTHG